MEMEVDGELQKKVEESINGKVKINVKENAELEKRKCAEGLLKWIEQCPSKYHVIERLAKEYESEGFLRLEEGKEWKLRWGKSYVVTRNGASLIAFCLPKKKEQVRGYHVAAAHCDSPTFQVKENPERSTGTYLTLNVERYGGMIYSSWLDRPLSVAGRIALENEEGEIITRLVNVDRDLMVIPNLAIHMNRDVNKGVELNPQVDLQPLFAAAGEEKEGALLKLLAQAGKVEAERILGHDLFLYVRDRGRLLGAEGEMILSPRLDDLQCVYPLTRAHAGTKPGNYITVCAIFDNEEVGSGSIQGADSTFLEDVLLRMGEALEVSPAKQRAWIAAGFLISADNAHAVHPNHPEKADPTNRPVLNGGIVIKYNSNQKYTTDGPTGAKIKSLCQRAGVPWQVYVNRSDVAGGSTLGNISTAHVSLPSADIGLPQLAMHSAVETAGTEDTWHAWRLMKEYFAE